MRGCLLCNSSGSAASAVLWCVFSWGCLYFLSLSLSALYQFRIIRHLFLFIPISTINTFLACVGENFYVEGKPKTRTNDKNKKQELITQSLQSSLSTPYYHLHLRHAFVHKKQQTPPVPCIHLTLSLSLYSFFVSQICWTILSLWQSHPNLTADHHQLHKGIWSFSFFKKDQEGLRDRGAEAHLILLFRLPFHTQE